jgi:O-antigen/teichoic acid export membrane protein
LKLRARHIARNVIFNWLGNLINMAVGVFLSPFILHHLGDVAYGVWVLAVSVVGYLTLLDFGMQGSILRFVNQGHTKQDHEFASEAASAALWVRLQISALALILSGALAAIFPLLFKIPPDMTRQAREAILLIGCTTAVTLSIGVYGGVISALNRYDLQNYVTFVQTAVRVIGVVVVLRMGYGIVSIAFCELLAAICARGYQVILAKRIYPELRIRVRRPKRETLKKIWSYSAYAFLATIAVQLVYQSDNLVVGAFISAAAVTFYAIASSLCRYATQVVNAMSSTFMPAASTYESAGDSQSLLSLYKNGTRATIMVSLPMMLTLILRGSTFIGLWMGPRYAHVSGTVLILLSIPMFFLFANQTPAAIAFGIEKHKTVAIWAFGEGITNLVLSIVLVHFFGIYGVALGTLIPSLIVQLGFWPQYASRMIGLSPAKILLNVWGPMILAGIPFAIVSYLVDRYVPARNLAVFALQVLLTLPVYFVATAVVFRGFVRQQILPRLRSMFFAEAA